MNRVIGTWFAGFVCLVVAGCSLPSHGRMGHAVDDDYWSKARQDMAGLITKHVDDGQKAREATAAMDDILTEIKQSDEQNRQYHRRLYELNMKYDASPEEFTKILDELNNSRMRSAARILGLRFKLKTLLSAEEWNGLSRDMMAYGSKYYGKGEQPHTGGY